MYGTYIKPIYFENYIPTNTNRKLMDGLMAKLFYVPNEILKLLPKQRRAYALCTGTKDNNNR